MDQVGTRAGQPGLCVQNNVIENENENRISIVLKPKYTFLKPFASGIQKVLLSHITGLFSVKIRKKFLAIKNFSVKINASFIDISRIKWLVFYCGRLSSAQLVPLQAPKHRPIISPRPVEQTAFRRGIKDNGL